LIILDYHLDGINPGVMKGNQIAEIIEKDCPSSEIIIVSSDKKFKLLSELHLSQSKKLIYKDDNALKMVKEKTNQVRELKTHDKDLKNSYKIAAIYGAIGVAVLIVLFILIQSYYV